MKQLLEDYKRRLKTTTEFLKGSINNGSINDQRRDERMKTKQSCYRTFIAELEKEKVALKSPEMLEALKGLYELRSLIYYPEDTRPEHANEALAVHNAMTKIESIIKDLE